MVDKQFCGSTRLTLSLIVFLLHLPAMCPVIEDPMALLFDCWRWRGEANLTGMKRKGPFGTKPRHKNLPLLSACI